MSGRHLYLCGISHEKASSEQLGKCSVAKELCAQKESEILEKYGAREVLLLSTCNRVEYYIESQSPIDMREFATGQFGDLSDICHVRCSHFIYIVIIRRTSKTKHHQQHIPYINSFHI